MSLESALSASRTKLKEEQQLRRAAEQAQDEADQKIRALEQSNATLREECDEIHEELAFKESELEETRLELEVEKQQLENEANVLRRQLEQQQQQSQKVAPAATETPTIAAVVAPNSGADEGYAQRLEDELEVLTEQLIDTEKRLATIQEEMETKDRHIQSLESSVAAHGTAAAAAASDMNDADSNELIGELTQENVDLRESEQRLRKQLTEAEEELALCREENHLQTEELVELEQNYQALTQTLEQTSAKHSQALHQLQQDLSAADTVAKSSRTEATLLSAAVQKAQALEESVSEQVAALENALANSKKDYQSALDELDLVNARFDEARAEAEQSGREAALEEARTAMRTDAEHEIRLVQETLAKLTAENQVLQQAVDDAEMRLAEAKDKKEANSVAEADSEVVKQLNVQMARVKEDLMQKDKEMAALTAEMDERLQSAETAVTHLEAELHAAKGQLAEADAHLIVLRKEKERKANAIPYKGATSPSQVGNGTTHDLSADVKNTSVEEEAPRTPSGTARGRSSSPSSVMRLEMRLAEAENKSAVLEKEYNEVLDQKRMSEVRVKRLEEDVKILQKQFFANASNSGESVVTTQMSRLSSLGNAERGMDLMSTDEVAGRRLENIIGSRDVKAMAEELKQMEKKCSGQREYNAQLLSKMLHLQGNIQVYCRIRPMSIQEIQNGAKSVVEPLSETEVGCFDQRTNKWKSFAFDRVWGPDQSQTSVFQDVEPLALSVVDGFNACIFA